MEKTATNNPRRKAWNTSFPHSPQKESTLLTPWLKTSSLSSNEFACRYRRHRFNPWVGKVPWRRAWQPTPVFLLRESHGQRSLAGCSPLGHKESNTTEQLNNNSLQKCTTIHPFPVGHLVCGPLLQQPWQTNAVLNAKFFPQMKVSQAGHCWDLGPDNSTWWGPILHLVGCSSIPSLYPHMHHTHTHTYTHHSFPGTCTLPVTIFKEETNHRNSKEKVKSLAQIPLTTSPMANKVEDFQKYRPPTRSINEAQKWNPISLPPEEKGYIGRLRSNWNLYQTIIKL